MISCSKVIGRNAFSVCWKGQMNLRHRSGSESHAWVEYGLGVNFNLTPATYFWADVERTSGGVLDEDWRATVGVRHAF